jgi:SAM-dependent methyltransferase
MRQEIVQTNKEYYDKAYSSARTFLRYPADWIIRFHNMYMRPNVPSGRVFDYGFGSGNNAIFFMQKGYEVHGLDITEHAVGQLAENLKANGIGPEAMERFKIAPYTPGQFRLAYPDGHFDAVVSNQVLYFLPDEQAIREVTAELARVTRPGGAAFFTMMGPSHHYIRYHATAILDGRVFMAEIEPPHRLAGLKQMIFLVRDEEECADVFSAFECVDVGYFDQRMLDLKSNHHWIFIGRKRP